MDKKRTGNPTVGQLEKQIEAWRAHLRKSQTITSQDAAELEDHLREQIAALGADGLSDDEAFLVAVKRMGAFDALTREFSREHSDRLWKQLVLSGDDRDGGTESAAAGWSRRMWVALGLAIAAAVAIKIPALFGIAFDAEPGGGFYARNISFFAFPFIAAYFAWDRPLPLRGRLALAAVFAVAATVVNAFPFAFSPKGEPGHTFVLTRIFAPLFALLLIAFIVTMATTGRAIDVKREVLILFDLLLAVVFGLLLYSASARDAIARPGLMDWIQLTLVGTALAVDVLALWAIGSRIFEFGFTPNRVAALGENIALLVNLGGSAVLYAGFIRGRVAFSRLCDWQKFYLYVLAAWAAVVALLFPLVFGFA
jgi:hypothetical protein